MSAEAFHVRLIWFPETAVPMRAVGTEGGVVSVQTVTALDVASLVDPLFVKKRKSYWPAVEAW